MGHHQAVLLTVVRADRSPSASSLWRRGFINSACACQSHCTLTPLMPLVQVLLLSLLFTGYLVNIAAVWVGLRWAHYLSVFFYGFESLIVNEMSGISLIFSVSPVAYMLASRLQPGCAVKLRLPPHDHALRCEGSWVRPQTGLDACLDVAEHHLPCARSLVHGDESCAGAEV